MRGVEIFFQTDYESRLRNLDVDNDEWQRTVLSRIVHVKVIVTPRWSDMATLPE